MVLSPALALCHTLLSLFVQLLPEEQLRLLTMMFGGRASPLTSSPWPAASGLGITPHSMRTKPARILSCFIRLRAAISEQSMPVEVIWARTGAELRTHATSTRIGGAMYDSILFVLIFTLSLVLFLGRSLRLRAGNRLLRWRGKVLLVHPDAGFLFQIVHLVFQFLSLQFFFDLRRHLLQIFAAALNHLKENKRAGSVIQFSPPAFLEGEC